MKSYYLANSLLNHQLGGPAWLRPATVEVGLNTGDPGLTGSAEVAGNNYARVSVANVLANWSTASVGVKWNLIALQFPTAAYGSSGWGLVTHVSLWAGTEFLRGGELVDPVTLAPISILVSGGDAPYIPIGGLKFTET